MEKIKKICFKCKEERFIEQFYKHPSTTDGHLNKCRSCTLIDSKNHYKTLNKVKRNRNRRDVYPLTKRMYLDRKFKKYGITTEKYNELFTSQQGCCAICLKHQNDLKFRLYIDHNHTNGEVRGLLCQKCNVGIGMLNDDDKLIERALIYLRPIRLKLMENQ